MAKTRLVPLTKAEIKLLDNAIHDALLAQRRHNAAWTPGLWWPDPTNELYSLRGKLRSVFKPKVSSEGR